MTNTINYAAPSGQSAEVSDDWAMIDALVGGTSAIRKCGKTFLPQWPSEDDENYQVRLKTAVLHPVFSRTCGVMTAKPFSRAMTTENIPDTVNQLLENVDRQGTPLHAFAMNLMFKILSKGLVGVLIDCPKAEGIKTVAQEKAAAIRPYFAQYDANSILGWNIEENKLTMLRLLEMVDVKADDFTVKKVQQVRILKVGSWETFRANENGEWIRQDEGVTKLDIIPFVFLYGEKLAYGVGRSPLIDLAFQNIEHYQSSSDQQTILHVARVPILLFKCLDVKDFTLSAASAINSNNKDADGKFVEHTGAAVESGRQSLLDLEDRMRATGAELISVKQSSNITATQISSEDSSNKSILQKIVEAFEESLEECIEIMCKWINADMGSEVGVTLYKDFNETSNSDATYLDKAMEKDVISKETMFDELKRRDIISPDRTWDDEQERLKKSVKSIQENKNPADE